MASDSGDIFSHAQAYEAYVGRWSRLVAQQFVAWLEVPPGRVWLDVGAGTGILASVILEQADPEHVTGVDLSEAYVTFARQQVRDARVEFRVGDASTFAIEAPSFDAAVAGLVLNFLPAPEQGLESMTAAVGDGGVVAAYVWDYSGRMEMMRHFWEAAGHLDPVAREMDAGPRFAICHPDALQAAFQAAGLHNVEVIALDVPTHFRDFDDYWLPFLGAQGSVSKYLRGLNDEQRAALRDQLQRQLPITAEGEIHLIARAWAAKGEK